MSFSEGFLDFIIHAALIWCALTGIGLSALLIRDIARGNIW